MARWHPTLTVRSERPAWRQALRGVAFFCAATAVILGVLFAAGLAKRTWDRHQVQRAERQAMASLGLRRICAGHLDSECLSRAATAAKVPVVVGPGSYGDLLVSTGPPRSGKLTGFAPVPLRSTQVRYAAFEQDYSWSEAVGSYQLITVPSSRPGRGHLRSPSIRIDGVTVDLWVAERVACGCTRILRDVWAQWHHDGHLYAAWFMLAPWQGPPAKVLPSLCPTLRYTSPG